MGTGEWNVFKQIEGGAWQYHVESRSTEAVYEIAAEDTQKLATSLGVDPHRIQAAWGERFGTTGRHEALTWLKDNEIPTTTKFAWINTDWDE